MSNPVRNSILAGALAVALVPAATAQTSSSESTAAPVLEEVMITAQKRTENLQDVPISVQAIDAAKLDERNVVSLSGINDGSVPGLNLAPYPGSSDFYFPTFRGITTNTAFISAPVPIAVHIDGVFVGQLVGLNNPAADLERIEVLKGPQGVLSGRNATGGALNIYTRRPELGQFGFKQQLTFADREQFITKTIVNVPFGDTFAAKLAYAYTTRSDEGIDNSAPGGYQFGKRKADDIRLDLRWMPDNTGLTVDYGYDRSQSKGYDTPAQCLYPAPAIVALAGTGDPRVAAFIAGCSPRKLERLSVPFSIPKNDNLVEMHTLNLKWEVNPALTIRSITGYRTIDTRNAYNYGADAGSTGIRSDSYPLLVPGTPFDGQSHPVTMKNKAFSEELQFLGEVGKSVSYTAGLYYASEDGNQHSGPNVGLIYPSGVMSGIDFVAVDQKGLNSSKSD